MDVIAIPGFSEPISCWTHLLAAALSVVGFIYLFRRGRGNLGRLFALGLFSFSLLFLFSMSGVYHLLEVGGEPRAVLQRLDHAAIWVLIAGTFTPIHTILFRGAWRWGILLLVWAIAITGLVLEVVFFSSIPEWLTLIFYLGLGWIGFLTAWRFSRQFGERSVHLLWLGGVFYSIGAVLEFQRWPILISGVIGPHEIFHLFVIAGAWTHWLFVYKWASHPIREQITFHVLIYPENRFLAKAIGEHLLIEAASLEALHNLIKEKVEMRFHPTLKPKIHLKYFKEEVLYLS